MATTIDEVLIELEQIIAQSIKDNDRTGYFAALYYKVTASVKDGIANNEFEDGKRMEQLDVVFANRYLTALRQYKSKQPCTKSWQVAFDTTRKSSALVLQQLLLGMNAHINLDLGIAAIEVAKTAGLENIHHDFNTINTIIASLTYQVVADLNRISPLLSLMGLHATNYNAVIIQFSINNARDGAWCFAEELSKKEGADYNNCIATRDTTICTLASGLVHAKGVLRFTLWLIHLFEWRRPSKIINALHQYQKKKITISAATTTQK